LRERARPGRPPLSFAVLAVAVLARPEGLLLLLLALLDRLLTFAAGEEGLRWRRPAPGVLAAGLALAACALAGPLLFYGWAGGSLLPTTFAAKGGGGLRLLPDFRYLMNVIGIFFRQQPWMTLVAGAGAVSLCGRLGTARDRGLLPGLWAFGLPLAYSFLTPGPTKLLDNFGRYYFPLFPVLILLGVLGLEPAVLSLSSRLRSRRTAMAAMAAIAAALIVAPTLFTLVQGERFYAQNVANVE